MQKKFVLSWVVHENLFITLGPNQTTLSALFAIPSRSAGFGCTATL